jgi:hypothetical protein
VWEKGRAMGMEDGDRLLTGEMLGYGASLFKSIREDVKEASLERWSGTINGEHIAIGVEKFEGIEKKAVNNRTLICKMQNHFGPPPSLIIA